MDRGHWLLVTIGAAKGKGLTPVQLQKTLFLLGRNFAHKVGRSFYDFVPYNYGPFSVDIYRDAELLQARGLVEIRREDRRWPQYYLTPQGEKKAAQIRKKIPAAVGKYIEDVVEWAQSLNFPALLRAIYEAYPEFSTNSLFQQ